METRVCKHCRAEKDLTSFDRRGSGYRHKCVACRKSYYKDWVSKNSGKVRTDGLARTKKYQATARGKAKLQAYRESDVGRQVAKAASRKWRSENSEKVVALRESTRSQTRQYLKEHYARNKARYLEKWAFRRAQQLQATPNWLTAAHKAELAQIYKNRPAGHHIDHIVPLQGNKVCGLHVPWNLQYLTASENRKKSNKF